MKYLSLFSGIGGFEVAIHDLFPAAECYGFSEIDQCAITIYQQHYPSHRNLGCVTEVKVGPEVGIDLLVGGSPCQDLSAGNIKTRLGKAPQLDGSKSKLFYEYLRILKECKPKYFILENVGSMTLKSRAIISEALGVEPVTINSNIFVPQYRKRLFWTNIKLPEALPIEHAVPLNQLLEETPDPKSWFSFTKRYHSYMKKTKKYGSCIETSVIEYNQARPAPTLLATRCFYVQKDNQLRYLLPIEAERLQSFPAGWTSIEPSNKKRMRVIGNAVTCDVVKFIIDNIHDFDSVEEESASESAFSGEHLTVSPAASLSV